MTLPYPCRLTLAIAPAGQPIIPGRIEWLCGEMLKTLVARGYSSRQLAEACRGDPRFAR